MSQEPVRQSSTPAVDPATRLVDPDVGSSLPASGDYRDQLRSRRWNAAPLRNPEVEKTDPRIAVAFIVVLAAITLGVLVLGYASGFWQLPG